DGPPPAKALVSNEPSPELAAQHHALFPPLTVTIDIRPGCPTKWIAPHLGGEIPVAILGSADLGGTQVDVSTLGLDGTLASHAEVGTDSTVPDGFPDLIAYFPQTAISVPKNATFAILTGSLVSSQSITGQDTITLASQIGPDVTVQKDANGYSATLTTA